MAFNKKYAGLPDLDPAPDIYETPELTDDSTLPTATVRSSSPFQDESSNPEIDRQRLQPDQARLHFLPARLDARDVNFSDSIASRRKSYRAVTRSRRRPEDAAEVLCDFSDDEDETLERKLARLRREAEELKEELANRRAQRECQELAADPENGQDGLDDGVLELSRALDNLHASSRGSSLPLSAEAILSQKLSGSLPATDVFQERQTKMSSSPHQAASPSGLLANAASFDTRLNVLEAALGIPNTPIPLSPDGQSESEIHPIIPVLNHLSSQLATLTSTLTRPSPSISGQTVLSSKVVTTPHLEALTTRIRKLTADADALSSARRRASEAARAVLAARMAAATADDAVDVPSLSSATETDSAANEQAAKIQALYTTLPTITSLHPLLPSVLERLRSLRAIHTGAARASEDLDALEQRQTEMKHEINQWREGLLVVEERVREAEATMKGNMEMMGPWVRDLETRLSKLEGNKY